VVGSDVQELRRHLAGELVRLQLLRDYRAPHVSSARLLLRRPFRLGNRRDLAPGQIAHLPFGTLGELVEAQDARVRRRVFVGLLDYRLGRHSGWRLSSRSKGIRGGRRKTRHVRPRHLAPSLRLVSRLLAFPHAEVPVPEVQQIRCWRSWRRSGRSSRRLARSYGGGI